MTAQAEDWSGGGASGADWKASEAEQEHKHEVASAGEKGDPAEIKCTACGETGHIQYDCPTRDGNNADHHGSGDRSGDRGGCFNCGEDGHNKADCTVPRQFSGTCHNCGRDGHMRHECPDAAPLTCRLCGEEGHIRKDCTSKPPKVCLNCGQDGHDASDCENPRPIDRSSVATVSPEAAWADLQKAVAERDLDDVKIALDKYFKNFPEMDYVELHKALRNQEINLWIIPNERKLLDTFTNMDLQGNLGKKYTISYRFSPTPSRPREAPGWPTTDEEILRRLADAGEVVDSGIRKCSNCDKPGHSFKWCPEEKQERERTTVMCYNCNETGHRMRDCPIPRPDKFACKNCGKGGHKAADCPEPRSAEGVDCRKCGETGHFSRDCPQGGGRGCRNCGSEDHLARECTEPRNMDNVECRNCDEKGHMSKECPKPRDYSRVVCQVCGEKGHTRVRCKKVGDAAPGNGDGFGAGENNYNHAQGATEEVGDADGWGGDIAASGGGW